MTELRAGGDERPEGWTDTNAASAGAEETEGAETAMGIGTASAGTRFAVAPFDMVQDLCGDPCSAGLVAFMAGNQFMVMPDLIASFVGQTGFAGGVYYETLPPGVLVEQLRSGGLDMGLLRLTVRPDTLAASPAALDRLKAEGLVGDHQEYATNELEMLVREGNPQGIEKLADLDRPGLRVALPEPATEGVGRLVQAALVEAGGEELLRRLTREKLEAGETLMNTIHHRESPVWLQDGTVDVALAWATEARFHERSGHGIEGVRIAAEHNQQGHYAIAPVAGASHPDAASAFIQFLRGATAQDLYRKYGFQPPSPKG
ncbi:MAG: substrate-binding domain-containing protein [Actinomycetota bacterium]|nr:substrate-binding domain-containing protein [Actinomycetota bacterium]